MTRRRLPLHRIVPAALVTVATAIPVATAVEILAHVSADPSRLSATAAAPGTSRAATSTPVATSGTDRSTAPPHAAPSRGHTADPVPQPAAPAPATPRTRTSPVPEQHGDHAATDAPRITSGGTVADPRSAADDERIIPHGQAETRQAQRASAGSVAGGTR